MNAGLPAACLMLGIELARSVADLNDFLRAHRPLIDRVHEAAPEAWDSLRIRTQARRQALPLCTPE